MEKTAIKTPWWKHSEVWLLALGPIVVVVAGFVTYGIAYNSPDSVIANDAYRKGQPSQPSMTPASAARNQGVAIGVPRSENNAK